MANRRSVEGSKSWLASVVGNITGIWESMKSSSTPNREQSDFRNSTNRHHDAGSEGDIGGRRSSSVHERGSSSSLGQMRRRSTVEATINTDGQSEHLDEDDLHTGRSSSFQEMGSFSFLTDIKKRSSNERPGSTDYQLKSFGEGSVHEERSSLQGGGSSPFLSQIGGVTRGERKTSTDGRHEPLSEDNFHEERSSSFQEKDSFSFLSRIRRPSSDERLRSTDRQHKSVGADSVCEGRSSLKWGGASSFLSSYRSRNQDEHSGNTESQRIPIGEDGTYEKWLSQKSSPTSLSRIKRRSKGDGTVSAPVPIRGATAQGSNGLAKSSRFCRTAYTVRASAMRIGEDSSTSMADVSASPLTQEEITTVAHNPRKRVYGREQLSSNENIFSLEMSDADMSIPKKARKITAEQPDLHQAESRTTHSTLAHLEFNFLKNQKFPTIFSSSAAQSVLSDSEYNDQGCDSPQTLSSRTKSILDGLDKVGSPIVNAHKWRFTGEPEQWASDLLNSSVQKSPANTGRTISRGNVVSDAISQSIIRHNHKRRRIARQQTRAIRSSDVTPSSFHVEPQRSPSKQPSPESSKEFPPVKVTASPRADPSSLIKPAKPILQHFDQNSTSAANNNFSAKWAELGVVRHEDISTQTTSVEPVTVNVEPTHYARPLSSAERMFDFSNAQRRAPSESVIKEDAHTAEIESRQLSDRNSCHSEVEGELVQDSNKKAAGAKNSTLQKGVSQGSQEGHFSEEKRTAKPHDGVPVENGGRMQIADANVIAASPAGFALPKDTAAPVQWSCKTCFVSNKPEADKCVACGESKGITSGAEKATGDKQWYCKTCFVSNGPQSRECSLCGQVRSDISIKNESFCKQCFVKIVPGKDNCVSCGAQLPTSTSAPVANVFGSRTFKPASTSGSGSQYVFGLASTSASSTSQVIPTDAVAAPISFGHGTSASANVSADPSGLQEAAKFDANRGDLTPKLGLPTSSSTPDVGTTSEQTHSYHPGPQNVEAEHKVDEVQASIAQSTAHEGARLLGASGTMGQAAPASVFPTLATPAANRPLAPSVPLFGSVSVPVSTTTQPAASAFNFGGTSETRPPTLFGFTTSGALHATTAPVTSATTAVPSFSVGGAPSQEDESDSRGAMASNSIEMMSPVEPPSESAATPVQPFSFGATANMAQPSGPFNFGTAAPAGPTGTSNTGGLFGSMNTNGALGIASAAPFQFHPPPAAARAFSTPSVVPPAPAVFNFGGSSAINGSTEGFSFGSTATPAVFNFGAQPGPAPSFVFGSNPSGAAPTFGAAPTTNFFASGSSSSTTTTRKMLKARRIRR